MANDNSAARNIPEASNSVKELRIEGERTAAMWANAVRVSRIDIRLRELASSTSAEGRKLHRVGDTAYSQAKAAFEDALSQIEKDLELNSRRKKPSQSQNPRTQPQPQRVKQGKVETGPAQKAEVAPLPTPKPTPAFQTTKSEQPQKTESPQAKTNAQPANTQKVNSQQPQNGQVQRNPGQKPQKQKQKNKGQQAASQGQAKQPQPAPPPKQPKPNAQAQAAQTPATA